VVVSTPDELDCIADGSVDSEGNITEDTLGRSDPDDVSLSGLGGRLVGRSQTGVAGLAFLNTVIVGFATPRIASRAVGRGRLGHMHGRRGRASRLVRGGGGKDHGGGGRFILGGVPFVIPGGKRSRGSPGARRRRVDVSSGKHAVAVQLVGIRQGDAIGSGDADFVAEGGILR
jgi:hypothetical protein